MGTFSHPKNFPDPHETTSLTTFHPRETTMTSHEIETKYAQIPGGPSGEISELLDVLSDPSPKKKKRRPRRVRSQSFWARELEKLKCRNCNSYENYSVSFLYLAGALVLTTCLHYVLGSGMSDI